MAVSIVGIIINVMMVIMIIVLIIFGMIYNNELKTCETKQSPFCYTIHCPCDTTDPSVQGSAPCFGYAKMSAGQQGHWYCSNAPLSVVDDNGTIV